MKFSIMGTILNMVICVIMIFIAPMYDIGLIQWQRSTNQVMYETRHLVDSVIDTRTLTKQMLSDYNLALASTSEYFVAEVIHETKIIDPDPNVGPNATRATYVVTEDIQNYKQGDLITVRVKCVSSNSFQTIAQTLLGTRITKSNLISCGKVR